MVQPGAASKPTPTIDHSAACHRRVVRSSLTGRALLQFAPPKNRPVDRGPGDALAHLSALSRLGNLSIG